MFDTTIKLYRGAVSFLIDCLSNEWSVIQAIDKAKARFNFAEKLVHTTKSNKAKYDFDAKFYKFPSYLRRAAIQAALGKLVAIIPTTKTGKPTVRLAKSLSYNMTGSAFQLFIKPPCIQKAALQIAVG